jgi:hypothetical protein
LKALNSSFYNFALYLNTLVWKRVFLISTKVSYKQEKEIYPMKIDNYSRVKVCS